MTGRPLIVLVALVAALVGGGAAYLIFFDREDPQLAESRRIEAAERRQAVDEDRVEALELALEAAERKVRRAARAGDPSGLLAAEAELEAAGAALDAVSDPETAEGDTPVERAASTAPIMRAPLFARQVISDDRLLVVVDRAQFCLRSEQARQAAVEGYAAALAPPVPIDVAARPDGPLLARANRLTARGRAC